MELVDTSDLKFDSDKEYRFKSGNEYNYLTKMVELADTLGLGSSSLIGVRVQVPFLVYSIKYVDSFNWVFLK